MRQEVYTPGYGSFAVDFLRRRRAKTHAVFFTPLLVPGMRLLDCGCGPGTITLDLARIVAPGEVVAVDLEGSQFAEAQRAAEKEKLAVKFRVGSAYELPLPDREFDAAFAHAVFEHLQYPEKALGEIRRVLKPGGCVGLRAPDWGGYLVYPTTPSVEDAIRYYRDLQKANGGDVEVGRKLGQLLRVAGFVSVVPSASYECYEHTRQIAEYLALRIEASAPPHGVGANQGAKRASALRDWGQDPDAFFAQAWGEAVGRALEA